MSDLYRIVRFYSDDRKAKVLCRNVSLEDAQAHCNDPETSGVLRDGVTRFFDGYERQEGSERQ